MTKKIFTLIAMTGFFLILQSLGYAQALPIFGPHTYTRERGKPEKFTETFRTCALSGSYKLIVENGMYTEAEDENKKSKEIEEKKGKKTRVSAGEIKINGKEVVREEDFNKRVAKIEKTVSLPQGENQIEVEVEGEPGASIAITIIGPAATSVISPQGGIVSLDGCASVIFPAGAFATSQDVTVSATSSPEVEEDFGVTADTDETGPRLPYEIRINSGNVEPSTSAEANFNVPDAFITSLPPNAKIEVFIQILHVGEYEALDNFYYGFSSTFDPVAKIVHVIIPKSAFTKLRRLDKTYEAIVIVGTIFK